MNKPLSENANQILDYLIKEMKLQELPDDQYVDLYAERLYHLKRAGVDITEIYHPFKIQKEI